MRDFDLNAGDLTKRITIQSLPIAPLRNDFNEPDLLTDWADVATVWAEIEGISGRELWYGQEVSPDVTHGITLRYFNGLNRALNQKMRFKFTDPELNLVRYFNIESVINVLERNVRHACMCKEAGASVGGS